MSNFVFVKKSEVTTAMLNRSTSNCITKCPEYTVVNPWYLFFTSDVFTVLEIPSGEIKNTNVFDNYQWYDENTIQLKLNEFLASQE